MFQGTNGPGNECSRERMFPRTKVPSWERMFQGTNSLENEYSWYQHIDATTAAAAVAAAVSKMFVSLSLTAWRHLNCSWLQVNLCLQCFDAVGWDQREVNRIKTVTIAPTLLCDYKPRHVRALCGGKQNVVCNCCYIILLFVVLFLFVLESKECSLAVHWTITSQTHAAWYRHWCFPRPKSPDVRHGDRSQLSRSLFGQIQVS